MLNFALVIHNHQPVENDDKVIETVYRMSYAPFLNQLANFPDVKANLHYSGYLLDWISKNHPEFVELLRGMIARRQVEMIGGGYYEPILSIIPDRDALGQIALLNKKVRLLFGPRPRGLWLAERAWEPNLPEILSRGGMRYTLLDDTIFQMSGRAEKDCFRPYITESRGRTVVVFPILKKLRYFIPFKKAEKTISYLRASIAGSDANGQERIAVFGDDGEKFGAWPTTYDEVYTRGWLERFFALILKNGSWLNSVRLSDYLSNSNGLESIHLPAASYPELMEWSLPARRDRVGSRASAGFWRSFLSKYPESAELYSRMLKVSTMVHRLKHSSLKEEAVQELWKAQYNDVYWHGIFGGLYFPKFRRSAYCHLLKAQTIVETSQHARDVSWLSSGREDGTFRFDTKTLGLGISPSQGGSVTEMDYKPCYANLADSLARRYETYHDKILSVAKRGRGKKGAKKVTSIHELTRSKETGLKNLLVYDRYPKVSFLDYALKEGTRIIDIRRQEFVEVANFAACPYKLELERGAEAPDSRKQLALSRRVSRGSEVYEVRKKFTLSRSDSKFSVGYDLNFLKARSCLFAVEINLGSLGDQTFEKRFGSPAECTGVRTIKFEYEQLGFEVSLEFKPFMSAVWRIPIRSVSQSESGFESNMQGISVIPNFEIQGSERENQKFEITVLMKEI